MLQDAARIISSHEIEIADMVNFSVNISNKIMDVEGNQVKSIHQIFGIELQMKQLRAIHSKTKYLFLLAMVRPTATFTFAK